MNDRIYLDYNATAKVRPAAAAAVAEALASGGNPSSIHADGRAARASIEAARGQVAALAGAKAEAVCFTSGGTEANGLAMASAVAAGAARLLLSATEHECVRESAHASGLPVEIWPVNGAGLADLDWLADRLRAGPPALVCLMLANNETGVIQPVAGAAEMARAAGAWLHVDAVQAAGKIGLDLAALGATSLALSAHKLGGPQGVGALVSASDARLTRQIHGGGQERGVRAGTENGPGIAGFGAAAREAAADLAAFGAQSADRDALAAQVKAAGGEVLGEAAPRLPQTLCMALPRFASEIQVMALDLAGISISAGAACSSGKVKASGNVQAMGRLDLAPFSVRVSGGWATKPADWRACGEAWQEARARHFARRKVA
jgi:cysteine desulfurase